MDKQVRFTDAAAIRKIFEGCEKRVFQHNRLISAGRHCLLSGNSTSIRMCVRH
ncbi:hypothetical protein [Sideroxydans sp. CL21]|nr:hypothetical protein [Sideroxydans sp. CL21]